MKKIIFLFAFIFALVSVNAQESATQDQKLSYDATWFTYNASSNATTATDSIWYFTTLKESKGNLTYNIKLSLDSVSGAKKRTPVVLKAKTFESDDWTTVTTTNWVNGRDTTILFSTATPTVYRYYQVYIKSDNKGFIFKVLELSKKFWE